MIPSLETYREIAQLNEWALILPEIVLAVIALTLLVAELLLKKSRHPFISLFAILGQVAVLALVLANFWFPPQLDVSLSLFSGMISHTANGQMMRIFFLLASILVSLLANSYLEQRKLPKVEFFAILLLVTASFMLLVQSTHFVMLFICLETVTVGFYVLVSYFRSQNTSLEGGLKYLIQGALSSSLLLFGIVLLYGAGSNPGLVGNVAEPMQFDHLATFISANPSHPLVLIGALLIISGLCFKMGVVPFQIWVPDVYQGAPMPVTAFLAVASKAGGFFLLMNLIKGPFAALDAFLIPLLSVLAALSILYGNLAALGQYSPKRLIGLSGISHAGYLLMGVTAALTIPSAYSAINFYLFVYLFGSFLVFAVMQKASPDHDALHDMRDYANLYKQQPLLGMALAIGLGSLAGIPPLAGFLAKLLLFIAAFQAGLYTLLGVAIFGVVVSIYYYFGWLRTALFRPFVAPETAHTIPALTRGQLVFLIVLMTVTVLLGVYPGSIGGLLF
ncbi:MAG: NADH-quinone oxidoreductase subunit N [Verrucomicrobiota bacterium]|nr:NADH-quinone oxidoreductase subunit N [Verrucomicrobiota bacterium]